MKKIILICTCFFILNHCIYAQKKKAKVPSKTENVHMYYDINPEPKESDLETWVPHVTKEMRAKWNLDETEINLSFVVEKNGMLSDPNISSDKWKPTKEDLNHLNTIINSKGKWTAAKIGKKTVRGKYFLTLEFR